MYSRWAFTLILFSSISIQAAPTHIFSSGPKHTISYYQGCLSDPNVHRSSVSAIFSFANICDYAVDVYWAADIIGQSGKVHVEPNKTGQYVVLFGDANPDVMTIRVACRAGYEPNPPVQSNLIDSGRTVHCKAPGADLDTRWKSSLGNWQIKDRHHGLKYDPDDTKLGGGWFATTGKIDVDGIHLSQSAQIVGYVENRSGVPAANGDYAIVENWSPDWVVFVQIGEMTPVAIRPLAYVHFDISRYRSERTSVGIWIKSNVEAITPGE